MQKRSTPLPPQRWYVRRLDPDPGIEFRIRKQRVRVLQRVVHRPWRKIIRHLPAAVDEAEVVVLVAVDACRQNPHKRPHAGRVIVNQPARYVLRLHRLIGPAPGWDRVELVIPELDVLPDARIISHQIPQLFRRLRPVSAVIHRLRIHVLPVTGIRVIGEDVDPGCAAALVQRALGPIAVRVGLAAVDHFRLRIGFVDGRRERREQASVLLGISPRIPVTYVLLVPQGIVMNPPAKMVHHPFHVADERGDLILSFRRPEDRVDAAVVIMKSARLGRDLIGPPPSR